jgi:hypothetical protein
MPAHRKHGESGRFATSEYRIWRNMIQRCEWPRAIKYHMYGARGIRVCPAWRADYVTFIRDVGRRPTPRHSLHRIDSAGNYEPANVRWATPEEQNRSRCSVRLLDIEDQRLGFHEAARFLAMPISSLRFFFRRADLL